MLRPGPAPLNLCQKHSSKQVTPRSPQPAPNGLGQSGHSRTRAADLLLLVYRRTGEHIMGLFRMDLQLHFFWSFCLTLTGLFWPPLLLSGLVTTIAKELLDLWSKESWSWGDFWWGCAGAGGALLFLQNLPAA